MTPEVIGNGMLSGLAQAVRGVIEIKTSGGEVKELRDQHTVRLIYENIGIAKNMARVN